MADNQIERPQPLGLFAEDLFNRAVEYANAFEKLTERVSEPTFPHASYFLLAHSLELFLKAFLASRNVDKTTLSKKLGHHLDAVHAKCKKVGIPAIAGLDDLVFYMREMNGKHDFRYPTEYALTVPRPVECLTIIEALKVAIWPAVQAVGIDAALQFASDTRGWRGQKVTWLE